MKRPLAILLSAVLLTVAACAAQTGETIDRIIATVNKHPLLLSDWEGSMRMEAFLEGRAIESFKDEDRKAALNRLIDRELLMQQMQADYSPTVQEIATRIQSVRAQLKLTEDKSWSESLLHCGLVESDVQAFVRSQLQVMRFVDLRLRPTVRVDEEAIEAYYRDSLVPELKKAGEEPEPLQQVRLRIREILVQQKMDGVLETWLANLRSQSEVHVTSNPDSASGKLVPGGGVETKTRVTEHK